MSGLAANSMIFRIYYQEITYERNSDGYYVAHAEPPCFLEDYKRESLAVKMQALFDKHVNDQTRLQIQRHINNQNVENALNALKKGSYRYGDYTELKFITPVVQYDECEFDELKFDSGEALRMRLLNVLYEKLMRQKVVVVNIVDKEREQRRQMYLQLKEEFGNE